jgi:hypothetical protein
MNMFCNFFFERVPQDEEEEEEEENGEEEDKFRVSISKLIMSSDSGFNGCLVSLRLIIDDALSTCINVSERSTHVPFSEYSLQFGCVPSSVNTTRS